MPIVTTADGRPYVKQKNRNSFDRIVLRRSITCAAGFLRVSVLALGLFATLGLAQGPAKTPNADSTQTREADLVHLGDVVDVDVVGSLDYDWRGTLTPEGFLDGLDKIEEHVFALCRSESDIGSDIAKYYGKFLRDPKIVVRIVDRGNRALTIVDGAVKKPQRFRIRRAVLLSELIILSGGITDRSSGEISIYRPKTMNCAEQAAQTPAVGTFINVRQGNDSQTINIRISDLLTAKAGSNPEILSGDIVTIVEAAPIYVIGGVGNPHQLSSREQTTLSRAIAAAGGISKDGVESQIAIFRREGRQSKIIETDLEKIRDGQAEDIALKPFDIVSVGQKGRAKAKLPPAFSVEHDRERLMNLPIRIIDR